MFRIKILSAALLTGLLSGAGFADLAVVGPPVTKDGQPHSAPAMRFATCESAVDLTLPFEAEYDITSEGAWLRYTPATDSQLEFSTCHEESVVDGDTNVDIYLGPCTNLSWLAGWDRTEPCNGGGGQWPAWYASFGCEHFTFSGGEEYYIWISDYNDVGGHVRVTAESCGGDEPCEDPDCTDAVPENEPYYGNIPPYEDLTNGGCNFDPETYGEMECGEAYCGTLFTFLNDDTGLNTRDLDWFLFTLDADGTVTFDAFSCIADYRIWIAAGDCDDLDVIETLAGSEELSLTVGLDAGEYMFIIAPDGFDHVPDETTWRVDVSGDCGQGDPCEDWVCDLELDDACGDYSGELLEECAEDWYCFSVDEPCVLDIYTCNQADFDTKLWLYDLPPCDAAWDEGTYIAYNDDGWAQGCTGFTSYLDDVALDAGSYYLRVNGYACDYGSYAVSLVGDCCDAVFADEQTAAFELVQNYPNPFNPTTTIAYHVPETGMVSLRVYNVTGAEVAVLVNGMMEHGAHSVVFEASMLSAGVYFYTLETGGLTDTRKMVLVK